jgi:hypothetical protein
MSTSWPGRYGDHRFLAHRVVDLERNNLTLLENGLETVVMVIKAGQIMKDNLTAG